MACFYLVFTIRLLPLAFPAPTPTATLILTLTPTVAPSPTPTMTVTPSATATATATSTPISSPIGSGLEGMVMAPVLVFSEPDIASARLANLPANTRVSILASYGYWLQISWQDPDGTRQGWTTQAWIFLAQPLPPEIITPAP